MIGAFRDTATTGPQVSRSIAYLNATLAVQPSTSTLFDALSTLVTADDASDPQAFGRLTPEPYAAAVQMHVDNALALSAATRGGSFAASGDAPHLFTFGATLGDWHRLSGDAATGPSAASAAPAFPAVGVTSPGTFSPRARVTAALIPESPASAPEKP